MIIGLPGEDRDDYLRSAEELSAWPLNNVKFHQLQVIHGTPMAREFKERPGDFPSFTVDEYLELMADILEKLNPSFVVERIAGEVGPGKAVSEGWGIRYDRVLRMFEEILENRDSWQGKLFKEEP
jgi:radical SAM superfamily enzyme